MEKEQKQDFTRRLSCCNRGEMIVIIYDIAFAYIEDIRRAHKSEDWMEFKLSVHRAQDTLQELIHALDFAYPIAKQLYQLYVYCNNQLARVLYERHLEGVDAAEKVLKSLYSSFVEAAKQDTSGPLMSNAQPVYAGMTYGRRELTENYMELDYQRGFLV